MIPIKLTICLTILDLVLMTCGQQTFPPIIPTFPPPTMNHVVNESLVVFVGEPVTTREYVRVTIDCSQLINQTIVNGIPNPLITWFKDGVELSNGSQPNVVISADRRFCIIVDTLLDVGGQLGNDGNYTCKVCANATDANCRRETTCNAVCGFPNFMPLPITPPVVLPIARFIILTCGQDVTVESLIGVFTLIIQCAIFNGLSPWTTQVYKDGELIRNGFPLIISPASDNDFGTYTFALSTEKCGTATAVSRIIRQGAPPDIDEGPFIPQPPTVSSENMTVDIGTSVYIVDGVNVTIDCNILNGTHPITITWLRNGLPDPTRGNVSSITINHYSDKDVFTCRAENIVGYDMKSTTINVIAERNCSVSTVSGSVNHSRKINMARFRFSSDGSPGVTYRCRLDDGELAECKSPMVLRNLKRGRHTIALSAFCIDNEGNGPSRNFNFRVR